ncbi:hypothetical protein RHSIM_Rhsim08G0164800 [Rhododendron simsii]|uniref:Uncharacterized protein n=1 Tax=Rhododendron simsii TaxID=118357 RepID=A0A834GJL1_RHOSS|nr:hypothetical protein RHSIM_Rhsim08G0164800 [Rhododendron simsii]
MRCRRMGRRKMGLREMGRQPAMGRRPRNGSPGRMGSGKVGVCWGKEGGRRDRDDPNVLDCIDAIPFVDTPLHTAASAGHTDFAVEILRLKPSFGRKLNPDGLSSLHLALINHKFETVKRLIKLDKELIRVKGKQGETPLHFIAKKEDINADQQQRVLDDHRVNADIQQQNVLDQQQRELDDHRVNTLADFLFACPNSIVDLSNQNETALHIAAKTKNKSAVEIILGLIRRIDEKRLMANNDDKGTLLCI